MIKKLCEWCGNEFSAKNKQTKACSEKCRQKARKRYFDEYNRSARAGRNKYLTEEEKKERFPVELKTEKGIVSYWGKEFRAVRMSDPYGRSVVFQERGRDGIIDTISTPSVSLSFQVIT